MARTFPKFTKEDGYTPADLVHYSVDHISAAKLLFDSNPSHYDSAGYLAHIGVELLLKGWILEARGYFEGNHNLQQLYKDLVAVGETSNLDSDSSKTLSLLDTYEKLRYPGGKSPTEVGLDDWPAIESLIGNICRAMPPKILEALDRINSSENEPIRKGNRVLMMKKIHEDT